MLVFFDETFRESRSGHKLGALCGIAIPEEVYAKVATDIFSLKYSSFGEPFAKESELKGNVLLKPKNFREPMTSYARTSLEFVRDLLRYINRQKLVTLGVVCFDTSLRSFRCKDPHRLEVTYRSLFERLDGFMGREFPTRRAKIILDDVDYGMNLARSESVTNFFTRSGVGRGFDSIIRVPFFAVSQAQNIGLQLADLVTTVYGMRFEGRPEIAPFWTLLKESIYRYEFGRRRLSTLAVFREQPGA